MPESPPKRAVLLVNTKSRRGQEWAESAKTELSLHGVQLERTFTFKKIDELMAEARSAINDRIPLVIAGGGDGTFSAITHLFVGGETTLGVLPLGTGNAFARDLGIPAEVNEACRIIAEGRVVAVDAGRTGEDYFVNVATVGLTTRIAQNLTNPMKRQYGRFVYAIALYRAMQKVRPFVVRIKTENGENEFETMQVVIGNGRFHAGPFPLSQNASITDGKLTLYALKASSKGAFLKLAIHLPGGTQGDLEEVHSEETAGGRLETFPPMPVTVDGEVCPMTPFDFGVAPKSVRVIVPESFQG
ncbi:YegS/Rv2252/BmrU family lipid kinase [bacterium]|nr:MAG: YegS/Rv2252/BmrU family lipid kinase [bacterium]